MDIGNSEYVAHLIQVALTPVFLLTAVATLLNTFSARLGRVADRVDLLTSKIEGSPAGNEARIVNQLKFLRLRSLVLDAAVVIASTAGALTCGATLVLFIGALRNGAGALGLLWLFGLAVTCAIVALILFVVEMLMASKSLRSQAEKSV